MYKATIGIEVHAQIKTKTKMFCGCKVEFLGKSNTNICPVCMGEPGTLPRVNKRAVELAVRTAIALHARINMRSIFARKNYFYPDLPKGYQITQSIPLAEGGYVEIDTGNGKKKIAITRLHIEEDAGKLFHTAEGHSFVDFNRSGVPLMEIVSEPVIKNEKEAVAYLKRLRQIVRYVGSSDADMEKGQFRCEPNISVSKDENRGTKTEVKNLNSLKAVERAIKYEISRQIKTIDRGEIIIQQTMLWDKKRQMAIPMRKKEGVNEYRYFKEPDLIPLILNDGDIEKQRKSIPELPGEKFDRLIKQYGIKKEEAEILVEFPYIASFFEKSVESGCSPKYAIGWITTDILGELNKAGKKFSDIKTGPSHLAALNKLIDNKTINMNIAKNVLRSIIFTGEDGNDYVKANNLAQVTDENAIENAVKELIEENAKEVERYKNGEEKLFGFFVGQVMKKMRGKANPGVVNKVLKDILNRR
ncbi:MAG: Asp-tRNA(Asn)/Glu-tRNA(Gln) amidotransferase subunit GatB [Proteobacteria bacterium]|nr:Asp-tRNA(Asn)/Glu-tRNA(Gln) amidotransferase subunit GatB [Pseudomonadota bacterium]